MNKRRIFIVFGIDLRPKIYWSSPNPGRFHFNLPNIQSTHSTLSVTGKVNHFSIWCNASGWLKVFGIYSIGQYARLRPALTRFDNLKQASWVINASNED